MSFTVKFQIIFASLVVFAAWAQPPAPGPKPVVYKPFGLSNARFHLLPNSLFPATSPLCTPNGGPVTPFPGGGRGACPYNYATSTQTSPNGNSYNPQYCNGSSTSTCYSPQEQQLQNSNNLAQEFENAMNFMNPSGSADALDPYGGARGSIGYLGSGKLDDCGTAPAQVLAAVKEAIDYRNTCKQADRGANQKILINDYSYVTHPPYMYIFDAQGTCLKKTAVTYGNGKTGPDGKPLPCSGGSTHLTPPGFHLTGPHNGATYGSAVSFCMVALEGQGSCGRSVLIHPAESPGTASSWGCSGVGSFLELKRLIGEGSLVYNYFGNTPLAPGCSNSAGWGSHHVCGPMENVDVPPACTGEATTTTK